MFEKKKTITSPFLSWPYRVSRNAQKLFKAMIQLRGQMTATRQGQEEKTSRIFDQLPPYSRMEHNRSLNEYNNSVTSSNSSVILTDTNCTNNNMNEATNNTTALPTNSIRGHVGVNSFAYPPSSSASHSQQQQQHVPPPQPPYCNPQPPPPPTPTTSCPVPSMFMGIPPKSLTEEADEEITKILAKLQKEDRSTVPLQQPLHKSSLRPSNVLPISTQQQSAYQFSQRNSSNRISEIANQNPATLHSSADFPIQADSAPYLGSRPCGPPEPPRTGSYGQTGTGQLYVDPAQTHSLQWNQGQILVKEEQNGMFGVVTSKKSGIGSVAAPQLRSLLARKVTPGVTRVSTQNSRCVSLYESIGRVIMTITVSIIRILIVISVTRIPSTPAVAFRRRSQWPRMAKRFINSIDINLCTWALISTSPISTVS